MIAIQSMIGDNEESGGTLLNVNSMYEFYSFIQILNCLFVALSCSTYDFTILTIDLIDNVLVLEFLWNYFDEGA